ncbi:MAG TPA: pyridoxamine 5'-phosphate oxidase family protein [Acidimicrobiales bacterium]|nr:pyridoxamine 5'-phosphate oxidase family protein [Acidimicrobiales bacterium]
MSSQTWLIHMSERECASHLAESQLGRLGVIVGGRPEVFPVSYVVGDDGCVAFPTQPGTKLESALDWPWVGFEIDGVNATNDEGWSVMIVGKAEEIADETTVAQLIEQRLVPWRKSGSERWLRLVPTKVTGRRIRATP